MGIVEVKKVVCDIAWGVVQGNDWVCLGECKNDSKIEVEWVGQGEIVCESIDRVSEKYSGMSLDEWWM